MNRRRRSSRGLRGLDARSSSRSRRSARSSLASFRSPFPERRPVIAATTCSWLDVADREVARLAPEPQHEDPVGDLEHVGEVVADHDHRRSPARAAA